jgi:hypothetical protein
VIEEYRRRNIERDRSEDRNMFLLCRGIECESMCVLEVSE